MMYIKRDGFFNKICTYYDGLNKLEGYTELLDSEKAEFNSFVKQLHTKKEYINEKKDILEYLKNTSFLVIESYESGKPLSNIFVQERNNKIARLEEINTLI